MKRLLLAIVLLGGSAFAAVPTYVQSGSSFPGSPTTTTTVTLTVTAGNLLFIFGQNSDGSLGISLASNRGDTITLMHSTALGVDCSWTAGTTDINAGYYVASAVGGSTTITMTTASGFPGLVVMEYSGQAASPYQDCSFNHSFGTTISSGNITTSFNDELFIGVGIDGNGSTLTSFTAGYNLRQRNLGSGTFYSGYWDYQTTNTAGAYGTTLDVGSNTNISAFIAAFKPAGAAAAATQIGVFGPVGP